MCFNQGPLSPPVAQELILMVCNALSCLSMGQLPRTCIRNQGKRRRKDDESLTTAIGQHQSWFTEQAVGAQALGAAGGVCDGRPGLPWAGHGQFQMTPSYPPQDMAEPLAHKGSTSGNLYLRKSKTSRDQ